MNKLLSLAFLFLAACPADDAFVEPDAGTVVYPCSIQDPACEAAYEIALHKCDYRFACDPEYDLPFQTCVASVMESVCMTYTDTRNGHCYDDTYDATAVEACVSEPVTCGMPPTCML